MLFIVNSHDEKKKKNKLTARMKSVSQAITSPKIRGSLSLPTLSLFPSVTSLPTGNL